MLAQSLTRESGAESEGEKNRVEGDGGWVANLLSRWSAVTRGDRRHKLDSELGTEFLKGQNVVRAK